MKNGTRNVFIGLGIAAGALITLSAFTGKTRQKIKSVISDKLVNGSFSKSTKSNKGEDFYI